MIIANKILISQILNDSFKSLASIVTISILTVLFNEYFLKTFFEFPSIIPSVLGTALAFFIGFNNNQAYDRWWEARKIWGGLVNDSRSWTRQILYYTSMEESGDRNDLNDIKKRMIFRHIAFLYALKENLRSSPAKEYKKYLSPEEYENVESKSNKHNAILNNQSSDLEVMRKEGTIDGFSFLELNKMLIRFCDEMGKSERIKNTVFPTTYQRYTRLFIWIFIISVAIVTSNLVGYWSILFGVLIGSIFIITQAIGLALLNPFDEIISGIPLNQITRTIEINLLETLGEKDIPEPVKSVDNKYVM